MAAYLSTDLAGTANQTSAPVGYKPTATVVQARLKRLRGLFTLNTQTTSDTLVIGSLPPGATFAYGLMTQTVTFGATATVAIGTTGATGKYRAAAVSTAVDTPTLFGITSAVSSTPLAAEELVFVTIAAASLPASGTYVVDVYYSMPN